MKNSKKILWIFFCLIFILTSYCSAMQVKKNSSEVAVEQNAKIEEKLKELKVRNGNQTNKKIFEWNDINNNMNNITVVEFEKKIYDGEYSIEKIDNVMTQKEYKDLEVLLANIEDGIISFFEFIKTYEILRKNCTKKKYFILTIVSDITTIEFILEKLYEYSRKKEEENSFLIVKNNFDYLFFDIIVEKHKNDSQWFKIVEKILYSNNFLLAFKDTSIDKREKNNFIKKVCDCLKNINDEKSKKLFSDFINCLLEIECFFSSFDSQDDALSFLIENRSFFEMDSLNFLRKEQNEEIELFHEVVYNRLLNLIREIKSDNKNYEMNIFYFFSDYLLFLKKEKNVCTDYFAKIFDILGEFFSKDSKNMSYFLDVLSNEAAVIKNSSNGKKQYSNSLILLMINILSYNVLNNLDELSFKFEENAQILTLECCIHNADTNAYDTFSFSNCINIFFDFLSSYQLDYNIFFNFINNLQYIKGFSSEIFNQLKDIFREAALTDTNLHRYRFFFECYSWSKEDGYKNNESKSMSVLVEEESDFKKKFEELFSRKIKRSSENSKEEKVKKEYESIEEDALGNPSRRKKYLYTASKYGWMPIGGMAVLGCLEPVRNHAWVQSANEWTEEKWKYLWDALSRHEKTASQDVGSSKIKGESEGFFKQCKNVLLDHKLSLSCLMVASGMACYYFKNRDTITDSSRNKSKKDTLMHINENQNKQRIYF